MSLKLFIVLCACVVLIKCDTYPSCGGYGSLDDVTIEGCTPDSTCILQRGTDKNIEIDFTPKYPSASLEMDVYGVIGGIPIPFPGFDTDGCQDKYNVQCPLLPDTQYQYKNQLSIQPSYPEISLKVKWEANDENGDTIFCFLVDAKVQ